MHIKVHRKIFAVYVCVLYHLYCNGGLFEFFYCLSYYVYDAEMTLRYATFFSIIFNFLGSFYVVFFNVGLNRLCFIYFLKNFSLISCRENQNETCY